ncbi:MAG: TlpA disulfide reductase family protein [Chryseolinea sp.]
MTAQFIRPPKGFHDFIPSQITYYLSFITMFILLGCKGKSADQSAPPSTEQSIQDKVKIRELNGDVIDLSEHKGKTIFINFWATWCGPCIKEMPSIENAKEVLKESKIEFFIASNETVEQIQSFADKQKLNLHYVQLQNLEELGIPALPTTYIINPAGELVFSETGSREWNEPANIELLTEIINSHE